MSRLSHNLNLSEEDFARLSHLHEKYYWLDYNEGGIESLWEMAPDEDTREMISALLGEFVVVGDKKAVFDCKRIAEIIDQDWGLSYEDTYLTAICDNARPDGSQAILQKLKNQLPRAWREDHLFNSLPVAVNNVPNGYKLIILDDFIGTGRTVTQKMKYVRQVFTDRGIHVEIYVCSLAIMEFARPRIDSLGLTAFESVYSLKKGITETFDEPIRADYVKLMRQLEMKLHFTKPQRKKYRFGYKHSESLFSIGGENIPNNVFPVFWWPYIMSDGRREEIETVFRRF